ncbi:hypothetical protein J5226_17260 [Lysobacter sp. K5869]|uniref:hypothetical protein n=1 Tax=Lysobacter sp. K5869 TaxID=2820808 RepID=UPI001C05EFB3|nr:hypothetical protein [Lysobacter sp. K5869]QWP75358.1 hypothetical protein J5226_17260 [Lysobacter sp. K5869]
MKIRHALLAPALIALLFSWAKPASAETWLCDNDRSASQYPNCRNDRYDMAYRSGQRGDLNGDDRIGRIGSYQWMSDSSKYYYYYAYLANRDFTAPNALYTRWDTAWRFLAWVNQNTAPSGWNYLGSGWSSGVAVSGSNNGMAGADGMRGDYTNGTFASPMASAAPKTASEAACGIYSRISADVRDIQKKMLDSIDHYRTLSGAFDIYFSNVEQSDFVEFKISRAERWSMVDKVDAKGMVESFRSNGATLLSVGADKASYRAQPVFMGAAPLGPRAYYNQNCEPVYVQRQDPVAAGYANEVALPQNYAFWLSNPGARVLRKERILGRDAVVVTGLHDPYLRKKLNAARFTMWVDDATGVLLKLVGNSATGKQAYFIEVHDLKFDEPLPTPAAIAALAD